MELELIYADSDFCEQGVIVDFDSFDAAISLKASEEDNDFQLVMPEKIWRGMRISPGEYVYIPKTEWGGLVTQVRHFGADGTVNIYGTCWRGLLCRKIICPPEGETHLVIEDMDANEAISELAGDWWNGLLYCEQEQCELLCSGALRYRNLLDALTWLLTACGARLNITFEDGRVRLCASGINDRSADLELSGEYEADITCTLKAEKANHIIALGRGQLLERSVIELWRLPDGGITDDPTAQGVPEQSECSTMLYDYSSVEDDEQLLLGAKERLLAAAEESTMELELYAGEIELELTDLVSARDTLTETSRVLRVSGKEIKIDSNGSSTIYKLSESEG